MGATINMGDEDAVEAAKRKKSNSFTFPAITDFSLPYWERSRSTGDPLADKLGAGKLPQLNVQNYRTTIQNQVPVTGYATGALQGAGYSRSLQMNLGNFMNQGGGQQQQPTLTGYHWRAGTGGVSGGNDANADLTWSNGTQTNMSSPLGGLPALGSFQPIPKPQYPQAPSQYPTTQQGNINTNVPGGSMQDALQKMAPSGQDYNSSTGQYLPASTPGFMSATKGPSQFASAPRTTNQFGQTMTNTPNGGQITTDKRFPDKKNQPWLGGQSWGGY